MLGVKADTIGPDIRHPGLKLFLDVPRHEVHPIMWADFVIPSTEILMGTFTTSFEGPLTVMAADHTDILRET